MDKVIRVSRKEMEMKIRAARKFLAQHKDVYSVSLVLDSDGQFRLIKTDDEFSWNELRRMISAKEVGYLGSFHQPENADKDPSEKTIERDVDDAAALCLFGFDKKFEWQEDER